MLLHDLSCTKTKKSRRKDLCAGAVRTRHLQRTVNGALRRKKSRFLPFRSTIAALDLETATIILPNAFLSV
jgi:hypothetical protein